MEVKEEMGRTTVERDQFPGNSAQQGARRTRLKLSHPWGWLRKLERVISDAELISADGFCSLW